MARAQHTCTGCVPIDAAIIEVYIQLLGLKDSTIEAAERAEHAAEYAIGKSPYIGENGDWWEWDDDESRFIDTGVQAHSSISIDDHLDPTSTNPVQNKVTTEELAKKQDKLVSGENVKTVGGQSILGTGDIPVGEANAVKFVSQSLTDQQKTQARTNIEAYHKPTSGIPASDMETGAIPTGNEEDIDQNESGKLQFANRVYNAQQPNGMGYKILRKDATFASQVTDTNTIYEIRYPFNLNGASVSIPTGSVLKFVGGKLSNGTLSCVGTIVESDSDRVIFDGVVFSGTIESAFKVSWVKLIQDYSPNNIAVLSSIGNTVKGEIVWNVPEIYITWDASTNAVFIPIKKGENDFRGTHFYVKNVAGVNYQYLLQYNAEVTQMSDSTLADAIGNDAFKDTVGCIVATDGTQFVDRTSGGTTTHQYRKDIILVNNNEALNEPIAPYDDGETTFSGSYFLVDYDGITVKNIVITRAGEVAQYKRIIFAKNAFNLTISDCVIFAEETNLDGDSIVEISNVYGLTLKNILGYHKINYSSSNYIFTLDNIYGLVIDGFKATSPEWGIINGNNINKASARDSIFYRFDAHAYSRDFYFNQVTFLNDGVQAGCHFGKIVADSCTFIGTVGAIHGESSYNCSPYVEYVYRDCTFDGIKYFSGGLSQTDHFSATRRTLLDGLYYPVILVENAIVLNSTLLCIYQRANPTADMTAKLKNVPTAVVSGVHFENDGDFLFLICERAVSGADIVVRNMTQKNYNSAGDTTIKGVSLSNPAAASYKATGCRLVIDGGKIDAYALYSASPADNNVIICKNATIIYPPSNYTNPSAVISNCKIFVKLYSTTYRTPDVELERCELTGDEGNATLPRSSAYQLRLKFCKVVSPITRYSSQADGEEAVFQKLDYWYRDTQLNVFNIPSLTPAEEAILTSRYFSCFVYNTTTKVLDELLNGKIVTRSGATADRPVLSNTAVYKGFQYYDTDLGKAILWNGTAWVNMDGTALS